MKLIAVLLLSIICMFAGEASAVWVKLSDIELVEQSDTIVSATLVRIERQASSGSAGARDIGVLEIRDVLKGPENTGVVYLALPSRDGLRSSTDIHYRIGQQGLWFLQAIAQQGDPPLYRAGHPQRFLPDKEAIARIPHFRHLIQSRQ